MIVTRYLPPELMENIFDQLQTFGYESGVKKALLSCLFVSRYCRNFALPRLFHSISLHCVVDASLRKVELLLELLAPSLPQIQWMSVLPYIQYFWLGVICHCARMTKDFHPVEPCLLRLLSVLLGDPTRTHRLTSLGLLIHASRFSAPKCSHFTTAFRNAIGNLLKMPQLKSLRIDGAGFLSSDAFHGTHFSQLEMSGFDPNTYFSGPDEILSDHPSDEAPQGSSALRSLTTDTSFPFNLNTPASERLLESLDNVEILVKDEEKETFRKAQEILQSIASLKTLTLRYCELYSSTWPLMHWQTNFGDLQALETLEILISIHYAEADVESETLVSTGSLALGLLLSVLDTINHPIHRLAHIRWVFSLSVSEWLEVSLMWVENWLRTSDLWSTLDRRLASGLFPGLSEVKLVLALPLFERGGDASDVRLPDLDHAIATMIPDVKKEVFSQSVATLGENFKLELDY